MECVSCGFENPAGVKFCHECGVALKNRCPSCGCENPLPAKFCGECGAALGTTGQPARAKSGKRQGLAAWRATGAELGRPSFLALLAEAYRKVGQAEDGLTVL